MTGRSDIAQNINSLDLMKAFLVPFFKAIRCHRKLLAQESFFSCLLSFLFLVDTTLGNNVPTALENILTMVSKE